MPSGAKKRKAAKKKRGVQSTNLPNPSNSAHSNGDDGKHVENDVGGKEVECGSDGRDGKSDINESTETGKSVDGGSSESSSGSSSDDESRVIEISSSKVDDSLDGGIHISGKKAGVADVEIPSLEDIAVLSAEFKDTVIERKVDGEVIQSVEETVVILEPKEGLMPENDHRSALSDNVTGANAGNGVEHVKDVGVTEPLLKPTLHPVEQKTTWTSCCGLLEVFGK